LSHSGIVDDDVEASIAGHNLTNQFLSGCVIPQVGGESKDLGSFCSEFSGACFNSFSRGSDRDLRSP